jgi:hypothetical protein
MRNVYIAVIAIAIIMSSASAQNLQDSVPKAKTKLEQFRAKTGVVLIRGFQEIGTAQGLYNTSVTIECKEFTNVTDGKKEYGITIEAFKEDGRYDKKHVSYIDFDEIDSLIQGIEYISNVKPDVTKFSNFQADYNTKGDLKISTFNSDNQIMAAVTSGKIGSVGAYFTIEDLATIKLLLVEAKASIEAIMN